MDDITRLLQDIDDGDQSARDRLLQHVYPELKKIARSRLRKERNAETLNATGLVHEAYLRMSGNQAIDWKGRSHFFGAAAQTMRRILIDRARARSRDKRGGELVSLTHADVESATTMEGLIEVDNLLQRLEQERPRWVRIIECRYFAGLSIEETAETLGVSHATVSNDWRMARAWLRREMGEGDA